MIVDKTAKEIRAVSVRVSEISTNYLLSVPHTPGVRVGINTHESYLVLTHTLSHTDLHSRNTYRVHAEYLLYNSQSCVVSSKAVKGILQYFQLNLFLLYLKVCLITVDNFDLFPWKII